MQQPTGDAEGTMQFQVRKAVAGAAATSFDLEMPRDGSVNDLIAQLAPWISMQLLLDLLGGVEKVG